MELTLSLDKLNPEYFAPVQVSPMRKLCCCCPISNNVPILSALMVILNYDVWAFLGFHVIVGVLTGLARKEAWGVPIIIFNICVGVTALCYRSRIRRWLASGSHQSGTVDIFSIRRNVNSWHNFFFLYSSWAIVIYIFYFVWTIIEIVNPVKNSQDKDAMKWSQKLPDQKRLLF